MAIDESREKKAPDQTQSSKEEESPNDSQENKRSNELDLDADSNGKNSVFSSVLISLSFGLAVLSLFLVLGVMKKVDNNSGIIKSSVKNFETKTAYLKNEMDEKLGYVDFEINGIKSKVEKSQRIAAIMELKRALVTVQDASLVESSPELQVKSEQLISNIESFLQDLGETKKKTGTIEVKEAP